VIADQKLQLLDPKEGLVVLLSSKISRFILSFRLDSGSLKIIFIVMTSLELQSLSLKKRLVVFLLLSKILRFVSSFRLD
jgi:hypothetical protein